MKTMLEDGFLTEVVKKGEYFSSRLDGLAQRFPVLASGVRGLGLIRGLVMTEAGIAKGSDIVKAMFDKGFLMNFAGNAALRFVPPLTVSRDEIDRIVEALESTLSEFDT